MDLSTLIQSIGYLGITGIVFAESGLFVGVFLPGDSLLFTAGFLASQGIFDIRILAGLTFIAAVVGDSVGYAFGRHMGPKIFKREDSLLFHRDHLMHAEKFYEKHGGKTIIIARFMPFVRTFAPILAGVGRMHYPAFLMYNIVGGLLWAVGLSYAGFILGNSIPNVDRYLLPIVLAIIIASISPSLFKILGNASYRKSLITAFLKYRDSRHPADKMRDPDKKTNINRNRFFSFGFLDSRWNLPRTGIRGGNDKVKKSIPQDYHSASTEGFSHIVRTHTYPESTHRDFALRFSDKEWCVQHMPMSRKTTFRLGGLADFFVTPKTSRDAISVITACRELSIPLFVLGGGSNVLFSDAGWRGIIMQPANNTITTHDNLPAARLQETLHRASEHGSAIMADQAPEAERPASQEARTRVSLTSSKKNISRWESFENDRPTPPQKPLVPPDLSTVEVRVGAGASLQQLILKTHQEKFVGLESFAGIPARVGGALRNNIHGGPDNFDRYVKEVSLIHAATGAIEVWPKERFAFSYDHSILQQGRDWIVWEVTLTLPTADVALWQCFDDYLKAWQSYKNATQTAAGTAGCIYKNLEPQIARTHNTPVSAGAIIDQYIGLGARLRTVHVSGFHGNFLQNIADQQGTSEDMLSLINYIRAHVKTNTGVLLEPEIELVGF